jgi:multicomponent Na+:H+ antiporter subunit E
MHYLKFIIPLLILYLVMTTNLEFSNVITGAVIATGITLLLRPTARSFDIRRWPGALWAAAQYIVILIIDVIKSGVTVARIVLTPSLPINPGIVAIPSLCESELATALSAHAISITPGEVVIELDDQGVMYTHCLDATLADEYLEEAQRLRRELLQKIFV